MKRRKPIIKEGLRLHQIAGRPTKQQLILVFGKAGYLLTWPKRTERFGITPEAFQAALAKSVPAVPLAPVAKPTSGESKRDCLKPLFTLGQVVATPGVLKAIEASGDSLSSYLSRHQSGDWGEVDVHDRKENELSLEQSFRLVSEYSLSTGGKIWVITEADRSSTCVLLPEE